MVHPRRCVSFCFDDGLARSAVRVREIFERRGLAACFAVLAAPELASDPFIAGAATADWDFWRDALAAGHEVAPHGYAHEHLGKLPLEDAVNSIAATLRVFSCELPDFSASEAIFHLPYLTAPDPVLAWLRARVLGVRQRTQTDGWNDVGEWSRGGKVSCITFGPDDVAARLEARLEAFHVGPPGWLVVALHGLDGEGWGPIPSGALEIALDGLIAGSIEISPPARVVRSHAPDPPERLAADRP